MIRLALAMGLIGFMAACGGSDTDAPVVPVDPPITDPVVPVEPPGVDPVVPPATDDDPPICLPREDALARIESGGLVLQAVALDDNGAGVSIYANLETAAWALTTRLPDEPTCFVEMGEGYAPVLSQRQWWPDE